MRLEDRFSELGVAAADLAALASEFDRDEGVEALLERYGLEPHRVFTVAAVMGARAEREFGPDEMAALVAGAFVAGLLQGSRIAEQREADR